MSGGICYPTLPALGLLTRPSDNGEVLRIVGSTAMGQTGDYFADGGSMTTDIEQAENLKGQSDSMTQRLRVNTNSAGLYTWTYTTPFPNGTVPVIECCCEGPDPQAGTVVNAQVEGVPTNTGCKIRVSRSTTSIQVLGINVLSLSAAVATTIHITARMP